MTTTVKKVNKKMNVKNRMTRLGILVVIGLVITSTAMVFGAGKIFQKTEVYRGEIIDNELLFYDEEGNKIGKVNVVMSGEEIPKDEAELNNLLEIAKKDSRVQKLIEGKEYDIAIVSLKISDDIVLMILKTEGKYYKIIIDISLETVQEVEEMHL